MDINAIYHAALSSLDEQHTPKHLIAVGLAAPPRGPSVVVLALTQDCLIVHYATPDAVVPIQKDWIYLKLIKELYIHRKANTLTIRTKIDDWSNWNGHFYLQGDTSPLLEKIEKLYLAVQKAEADSLVRRLQEKLQDAQCARAQLDQI